MKKYNTVNFMVKNKVSTYLYFAGIVTIAIWALLIWNHYHGGVPSHHILAREDLPAISNWWGGLLIPLLTLFLLYRIYKRLRGGNDDQLPRTNLPGSVLYGFVGALGFGLVFSAFFTFGYSEIQDYMLIGLLLLSLFLPIYRAEYMLGLVIGMTYTFGAVLPTAFGCVVVLICAVTYLLVRPILVLFISKLRRFISVNMNRSD